MKSLFKIDRYYYRRVVRCAYANGTAILTHKAFKRNEENKILD